MKSNPWKLTVVVVLTILALSLAMLLTGCGPEEVTPTPTSPAPKATPTQAETPPTASSPPTVQVYYVAANEPGASDDNNGLYPTYQDGQDGPWLTIQHAANTMTAGSTTYVRTGNYHESGIIFAHSGAPGAPITLANYESEEVIIDGSKAKDDYPGIAIVEGRSHYVIQGFTVRNMPWSGIATDESTTEPYRDITIRNCVLHDNGWSGIDLAAVDGFVVENVEAVYGVMVSRAIAHRDVVTLVDGQAMPLVARVVVEAGIPHGAVRGR